MKKGRYERKCLMGKRLISMILTVCVIASCIPVSTYAAELDTNSEVEFVEDLKEEDCLHEDGIIQDSAEEETENNSESDSEEIEKDSEQETETEDGAESDSEKIEEDSEQETEIEDGLETESNSEETEE